jgi:uncharacterized protein
MLDLRNAALPAARVIAALGLAPHPEGGHFRETWRDLPANGRRGNCTAILYLLAAGERSHWHRIDATELWLWHAGAPLALGYASAEGSPQEIYLGPHLAAGETLQAAVPPGAWQAARSLGAWSLVACTVAPAFCFSGFELAPVEWVPGGDP